MTLSNYILNGPSTVILDDDRDPYVSWQNHLARAGRGGVDLVADIGTPVLAPTAGTVDRLPNNGTAGNSMRFAHDANPGWSDVFSHLDSYVGDDFQHFNQGDVIAYTGDSGGVVQHLHRHLLDPAGNRQNPWSFFTAPADLDRVRTNATYLNGLGLGLTTTASVDGVPGGKYWTLVQTWGKQNRPDLYGDGYLIDGDPGTATYAVEGALTPIAAAALASVAVLPPVVVPVVVSQPPVETLPTPTDPPVAVPVSDPAPEVVPNVVPAPKPEPKVTTMSTPKKTPAEIAAAIDAVTSNPEVIAVSKALAAKIPPKIRAIIYSIGSWAGAAAAIISVIAAQLNGNAALYAVATAAVLLSVSNAIAKANIA
jgi:hypothetical protein